MEATILESCHSTWIFDGDRMRFRRVLKDIEYAHQPVATDWRPYHQLQIDPLAETFTVVLNQDGTRLVRSWLHTGDCVQCCGLVTAELSLAELRAAVGV
jgi:hypothetical protein